MENMYNFDKMDADDYLKSSTTGRAFSYQLFESYIAHLYSQADKDKISINNYDSAYYSVACAQFYPNAEWLHPEKFPDSLIQDLLIIGMVENAAGVLRFKKPSYAYFFICKFLIRSWQQLEVVENLEEEFFGSSGLYLRLFLMSYSSVNTPFKSNLQALLKKNLFHNIQSQHRPSDLKIISPEQLNINMEVYNATLGYDFPSYFLLQTDLSTLRSLLTKAFVKVGEFTFEKTNEDLINNLGLLYTHFLIQAKLQNQLNFREAYAVLKMLDKNSKFKIDFDKFDEVLYEPQSLHTFLLENCNELQYVLLCQFIKFCYPNVRFNVGNMNNIRFRKITELQVPTLGNVEYIHNTYPPTGVVVDTALYLERYGLAITRGTMTFTDEMMYTFKHYLNINGGWRDVYQNKVLVELILPVIHIMNYNYPCEVNKQDLLKLLLDFSIINLTRTVESNSLKSTLKFIESMVVENDSNLQYLIRFLIYLSKHNFCLIRKDNLLKLINQNCEFVYNISTGVNVISMVFPSYH